MILVSRPAPQLPRTTAALKRAGFKNVCPLPVAEYESFTLETFPADATALILTSAAALTALMKAIRIAGPMEHRPGCLRFLPTYCVGPATARAAKQAGLNVAYVGKNNGRGMAAAIAAQKLAPQKFLHLHADNAVTAWAEMLTNAGHTVAGLSAYHTAYLHRLPPEVIARLQHKQPTHTLLFSPAGARRLSSLLQQANLNLGGTAIALSPAVAKAARPYWPHVAVAARPTLAGMAQRYGDAFTPGFLRAYARLLQPTGLAEEPRWSVALDDGKLLLNGYKNQNNTPFAQVRNTRVTTPNSLALGGSGKLSVTYDSPSWAEENSVKATYKRTSLVKDGADVSQKSDDEIDFTGEFRFKPLPRAWLADWTPLPFVNATYTTQFQPDDPDAGVGPVPLTPIMHWLREHGGPIAAFHQSMLVRTPAGLDATGVAKVLTALADRHDALRLKLTRTGPVWSLAVRPRGSVNGAAVLSTVDVRGVAGDALKELVATHAAAAGDRLDPEAGQVLAAV